MLPVSGQLASSEQHSDQHLDLLIAYRAPECFNDKLGGVSTKCDIFSLGVILWELVTQSRPWMGLNEFQVRVAQVGRLALEEPACPD